MPSGYGPGATTPKGRTGRWARTPAWSALTVDLSAFLAGGLLATPVGGEHRGVQDQMRQPTLVGSVQGVLQVASFVGEYLDHLVEVAIGGSAGDAVVAAQRGGISTVAKPAQAHDCLLKSTSAPPSLSGCGGGDVQHAAAGRPAGQARAEHQAWHDRQSRGALTVESRSLARPLLPRAPRPSSAFPHRRVVLRDLLNTHPPRPTLILLRSPHWRYPMGSEKSWKLWPRRRACRTGGRDALVVPVDGEKGRGEFGIGTADLVSTGLKPHLVKAFNSRMINILRPSSSTWWVCI